jgi:tRNA(fMet)-specific endonuclease VapC
VKYLLDSDVISFVAREANAALTGRVRSSSPDELAVSVVTRGEVEFGLLSRKPNRLTEHRMRGLLAGMPTLALNADAALHYARIRVALAQAGTPIGPNDLWIAAQALAIGLIVVTNNLREYQRVPGLMVENWLR